MQRARARQAPYGGLGQPWTMPWGPGTSLAGLFDLYPSQGSVVVSSPLAIPSLLDGPIQVARYGALTVNASITVSNRCRGLMILADTLTMGAAGSITMTNRGAMGSPQWINQNVCVPSVMNISGRKTSQTDFLEYLRSTGYCILDPNLWRSPPSGFGDVSADYLAWPSVSLASLIVASGCGGGANYQQAYEWNNSAALNAGYAGGAGVYAPGGGGCGSAGVHGTNTSGYICGGAVSGRGGRANIWGSGAGGGGCYTTDGYISRSGADADNYGWGGAPGQSGGQGAGVNYGGIAGCLFVIAKTLVLTAGHVFSSLGYGGSNNSAYGGSSGGGAVCVWYGSTSGAALTLNCTAGSNAHGNPGGAGSGWTATFASLGW